MKLDQIAFYAHNDEEAQAIKNTLGLADKTWVEDTAIGTALFPFGGGTPAKCEAYLQFNYDLGMEVEILRFKGDFNWHAFWNEAQYYDNGGFISHLGFHLEEGEPFPEHNEAPLVQELWTNSHTNPYLVEKKRTYHYRIHDARKTHGAFLKYIRRVHNP